MATGTATINRFGAYAGGAILGAAMLWSGQAGAVEQITGTTVYKLSLGGGAMGDLSEIRGDRTVVWTRDCKTNTLTDNMRAVLIGSTGRTIPLLVETRMVETDDAVEFDVSSSLAGKVMDRAKGKAVRNADGLVVTLEEPNAAPVTIPGEVLFPNQLAERAADDAMKGETIGSYRVFMAADGGKKASDLTILFLKPPEVSEEEAAAIRNAGLDLSGLKRWRFKVSYFGPGGGDQAAAGYSDDVVYENGFDPGGSFSVGPIPIRQTIASFTPIPPKPCP